VTTPEDSIIAAAALRNFSAVKHQMAAKVWLKLSIMYRETGNFKAAEECRRWAFWHQGEAERAATVYKMQDEKEGVDG
jgi:hypothetical protein